MKYFLTATLALALAGAASSALADPPPKDDHSHPAKPAPAHGAPPPGGAHAPAPGGNRGPQVFRGAPGPGGPQTFHGGAPGGVQRFNGQGPGAHPGGVQNRALRPSDQGRARYSAGAFQQRYVPQRRFHADGGAYPGGWYQRSWGYGDYLPFGWFAPDYYLDFGYYGLPEPPIGCEWVREGPDAVLVDISTGEVLSVENGLFY